MPIATLFPHLAGLRVHAIHTSDGYLTLTVAAHRHTASCPQCPAGFGGSIAITGVTPVTCPSMARASPCGSLSAGSAVSIHAAHAAPAPSVFLPSSLPSRAAPH